MSAEGEKPTAEAPPCRVTESQNGGGWQGPLGVPQPNPLPKQGHPEQGAQQRVQLGLEYLQRRRLHSLPGQPGPGPPHPPSEEFLPEIRSESPLSQPKAIPPCPITPCPCPSPSPALL